MLGLLLLANTERSKTQSDVNDFSLSASEIRVLYTHQYRVIKTIDREIRGLTTQQYQEIKAIDRDIRVLTILQILTGHTPSHIDLEARVLTTC